MQPAGRKMMALSERVKTAMLSCWLLLPSLAVLVTDHVHGFSAIAALVLFATLVLAFPLIFIGNGRWFFLLWAPVAVLVVPYCALTLLYGSVPGDALVEASLDMDLAKSAQVVLSFGWPIWLVPVTTALYVWLAWSIGWRLGVEARKRIAAGLLMYVMLAVVARTAFSQQLRLPPLLDQATMSLAFPSGLSLSLMRVLGDKERGEEFVSAHGRTTGPSEPLLVMLVVGESVRYDHLGINGYTRDTTPHLAALGKELLSFPDMASCCNWTSAAVPAIVSRNVPEGRVSLLRTFKEAGFRTAWLSRQEPFPFGADAHVAEYGTNTRDYHFRKDVDLLPAMTSFVRQAGPRQFVVLHMYGSHIPYEEQYDAWSRKYTPTMSERGVTAPVPGDKEATVNSYDNTIVEFDLFLSRVIHVLKEERRPAIVLFVSDHGENLFDDERGLFMHAQRVPTRHDTHVPLLAWMNQAYRQSYPDKARGLEANLHRKISHANMFPTLLDLGRVQWDGAQQRDSFAAPEFSESPRKVRIDGKDQVDYESLR